MPCDLVFSPVTIPVAYLDTGRPLASGPEATFGAMVGLLPRLPLAEQAGGQGGHGPGHARPRPGERGVLHVRVGGSQRHRSLHGADAAKVEVVPYGANMPIAYE